MAPRYAQISRKARAKVKVRAVPRAVICVDLLPTDLALLSAGDGMELKTTRRSEDSAGLVLTDV